MKYSVICDCKTCSHERFCKYSERYKETSKRLKDFVEMPTTNSENLFQVAIRCTGHPEVKMATL